MGELYSITGLFNEAFPEISPWGGHFIRGREGESENQIVGQLIDLYGPSRLEGVLEKKSLEFRKQYERCNHEKVFDYKFSLKNGIWQGEFSSPDGYRGRSICKTNLCLGKVKCEKVDLRSPEGYAKALIDSMVQTGYSETFEDPETGEEMSGLYDEQKMSTIERAKQKINPETGKPFGSLTELYSYRVKQRTNPETGEKFKSLSEYNDYIIRKNRVNPENGEHYKSRAEYDYYMGLERIGKNRGFSALLRKKLDEAGQSQSGLAKQLGVTKQAVSFYLQGRIKPKGKRFDKMLEILKLDGQILREALNSDNQTRVGSIDDLANR